MTTNRRLGRRLSVAAIAGSLVLLGYGLCLTPGGSLRASPLDRLRAWHAAKDAAPCCHGNRGGELEGELYWLRSPEQERRTVISLYNRYCIRCHGIDGRGVWDIPDVPDFTNARWQATRNNGQLARSIMEGRGAVMPQFKGTLTLEESFAVARYLRTFVPGTEVSRPDVGTPEKAALPEQLPVKPR